MRWLNPNKGAQEAERLRAKVLLNEELVYGE